MAETSIPSKADVLSKLNVTSTPPTPPKVPGTFEKKKKPFGRRMADAFIGKEVPNIGEYILFTALVPTLKRIICDIGRDLPELIFYGRPMGYSSRYPNQPTTMYSRVGISPSMPKTNMYGQPIQQQQSVMFDDITSPDPQALEVLQQEMNDRIRVHGRISIAEVNEMIRAPISPTDNNWGWTSLASADIRQTRDGGWILMMPRATALAK